jgi:uncharacterized membrane protein YhaH (DUF805 family)
MFSSFIGSLNKYVDFSGRATRKEFWSFVFFYYLSIFLAGIIDGLLGIDVLSNLVFLALILPYISCAVRRMHDVGKSGWFMIIPFYNFILSISPSVPENSEEI